jgi:hypothetical protein
MIVQASNNYGEVRELNLQMARDFQKLDELANSKYGITHVPDHKFHAGPCGIVKAVK